MTLDGEIMPLREGASLCMVPYDGETTVLREGASLCMSPYDGKTTVLREGASLYMALMMGRLWYSERVLHYTWPLWWGDYGTQRGCFIIHGPYGGETTVLREVASLYMDLMMGRLRYSERVLHCAQLSVTRGICGQQ